MNQHFDRVYNIIMYYFIQCDLFLFCMYTDFSTSIHAFDTKLFLTFNSIVLYAANIIANKMRMSFKCVYIRLGQMVWSQKKLILEVLR